MVKELEKQPLTEAQASYGQLMELADELYELYRKYETTIKSTLDFIERNNITLEQVYQQFRLNNHFTAINKATTSAVYDVVQQIAADVAEIKKG